MKGKIIMGFWEKAEKAGKVVAGGVALYLEDQSRSKSRSKKFSDEQREAFSEYADRMHSFRESLDDEEFDDEE